MKKLLIVAAVMLMSTGSIFAQDMDGKKTHHTEKSEKKMKDCITMKDGKMWLMKAGKTKEMSTDMTLANGTKVMTDGTVIMKDGMTMMMKDGESMMMNGKMKKMDGGM